MKGLTRNNKSIYALRESIEVSLRIKSKCGKMQTRNNPVVGHVHVVTTYSHYTYDAQLLLICLPEVIKKVACIARFLIN